MRPFVIGLAGRSGSGKSSAAEVLGRAGYHVIYCDLLSREVQRPGSPCCGELAQQFGKDILLKDGSLDRKRLGEICFSNRANLDRLNDICFKHILPLLEQRIGQCESPVCIVEAPAMYESGADALCDKVIVFIAKHEETVDRLVMRDQITREHAENRLNSQLGNEELSSRADCIIYNDQTLADLEGRALSAVAELCKKSNVEVPMEKEKTQAEQLAAKILLKRKSCFEVMSDKEKQDASELAKRYMKFLNNAKTERECVNEAVKLLDAKGFSEFDSKKSYKAGDKVYYNNRGKAIIAAVIGKNDLEESGVRIVASHTDSPRLDLKPYPLYEDKELAMFKTHYYGGIKKYQWTNIPLAIHGVVVDKTGKKIEVTIGEEDSDPVFYITNLLPHLSASHNTRTNREVIKGEELNVVAGSQPFDKDAKDAVKLNTMKLIHDKYGIVEDDFITSELEIVPAHKARYVGFDRSFIAAYGHDDRVCAYQALEALLGCGDAANTCLCIFADKEETGSDGNTGMNSDGLKNFIYKLTHCVAKNADPILVVEHSKCLSTDVTAGLDPTFSDAYDARNASYMNYGVSVDKYGGSGGKYGCNDATAEFMAEVCKKLNDNNICWQTGELGKVDEGGGGTVAKFISALNIDAIDCGVPLLSMHSPFELASVLDIYSFYQCCKVFFEL